MPLEIAAKGRLVRESKGIADLLDAHSQMMPKHCFSLYDDIVGNPLGCTDARDIFDNHGEVLR